MSIGVLELVDSIQGVLADPGSASDDRVVELAEAYSNVAGSVNGRIRRAIDWWRRGLVSEALNLVEEHPDVLDTAMKLELGTQKAMWIELCRNRGVSGVATVSELLAGELSGAYTDLTPIGQMLVRHRRLALSKAPLCERLSALRDLAAADKDNPNWQTQIQTLERARIEEILSEANVAVERADPTALSALASELDEKGWSKPPPPKLHQAIRDHQRTLSRSAAAVRLKAIGDLLHAAHGAGDESHAAELLAELDDIRHRNQLELDPSLAAEVEMVRSWARSLASEREAHAEFTLRVESLRNALDDMVTFSETERLHAHALLAERPLPEVIERRFRARQQLHQLDRKRRFRLMTAATAALIVIIGTLVGWTIWVQQRRESINQWVAQIRVPLENGDLEMASQLLERLNRSAPSVDGTPEVRFLRAQFEAAVEQDRQRAGDFTVLLADVGGRSSIDPAIWNDLKRLDELSKSESDRREVAINRDRLERERLRRQEGIDQPFRIGRRKIVEAHRALSGESLSPKLHIERLSDLLRECDALLDRPEGVSPADVDSARTAREAIQSERSTLQGKLTREEMIATGLERIPIGFRSASELAERMRGFIDAYPETKEAARFSEAIANERAWRAVEELSGETDGWIRRVSVASSNEAKARYEVITRHAAILNGTPTEAALNPYREYLKHAIRVLNDPAEQLSINDMRKQLTAPWITGLQQVDAIDGARYYTFDGIMRAADGGFAVLSEHVRTMADLAPDAKRRTALLKLPSGVSIDRAMKESGLSRLTKSIATELSSVEASLEGWESLYLRLASSVRSAEDLDPILAVGLVSDMLARHAVSGWPRSADFDAFRARIESASVAGVKITDLDWLDPTGESPRQGRAAARRLLAEAPDFKAGARKWDEAAAKIRSALRPYHCLGVVWPASDGSATVLPAGPNRAGLVLVIEVDQNSLRVKEVGIMAADGSCKWGSAGPPGFGTPVFTTKGDQ